MTHGKGRKRKEERAADESLREDTSEMNADARSNALYPLHTVNRTHDVEIICTGVLVVSGRFGNEVTEDMARSAGVVEHSHPALLEETCLGPSAPRIRQRFLHSFPFIFIFTFIFYPRRPE